MFEGNGDIGGRHDIELRTIAFFSALPQFQSRAAAVIAAGVSVVARLGFPVPPRLQGDLHAANFDRLLRKQCRVGAVDEVGANIGQRLALLDRKSIG